MRNRLWIMLVVSGVSLALSVGASAGKSGGKGKPGGGDGGGGTPAPAGTIYFDVESVGVYTMNGDGGGKSPLFSPDSAGKIEASGLLHDGERWFLLARATSTVLPDGSYQKVLVAESESGTQVQLWSDASARVMAKRWARDDSFLSFKVVYPGTGGLSAILRAEVDWSGGSPDMGSVVTVLSGGVGQNGRESVFAGFDWSPDGDRLVYAEKDFTSSPHPDALKILDTVSGTTTTLVTDAGTGVQPVWSPDGTAVAYVATEPQTPSSVWTIGSDGSEASEVASSIAWSSVVDWSPDGDYLIFTTQDLFKKRGRTQTVERILRVPVSGGAPVSLTDDLSANVSIVGWR